MLNKPALTIAFIDSGVGGLTILDEVVKLLPYENFIYLADYCGFPYGQKNQKELLTRLETVAQFLMSHKIDILVIACNTASTTFLAHLRQQFGIPIVGVIPPIKLAAKLSKTKVIGILGTSTTVKTAYTQKLIDDFAQGCQVVSVGSPSLVEAAERKLQGLSIDLSAIAAQLEPFRQAKNLDTVALSCTHFPHLIEEFRQLGFNYINFVSPAEGVARQTALVAKAHRATHSQDKPSVMKAFCTKNISFTKERVAEITLFYEKRSMIVEWVSL